MIYEKERKKKKEEKYEKQNSRKNLVKKFNKQPVYKCDLGSENASIHGPLHTRPEC